MFVRFLFDKLFILFRIAFWPSAGKELSSWFLLVLFLFCAVLIVYTCSFPVCCLGQDLEFVSVSDHCLVCYLVFIVIIRHSQDMPDLHFINR